MNLIIANWNVARHWPPWDRLCAIFPLFIALCIVLTGCEGAASRPDSRASAPPESSHPTGINPSPDSEPPSLVIDPMVPPNVVEDMLRAGQGSAMSGTPGAASSTGLPIAPSLGIKADLLFADPVKDPNERMARLENAVVDIRRELDATLPAVGRLVAIEGDIQELVRQLQTLTVEGGDAPAPLPTSDTIAPLDPTISGTTSSITPAIPMGVAPLVVAPQPTVPLPVQTLPQILPPVVQAPQIPPPSPTSLQPPSDGTYTNAAPLGRAVPILPDITPPVVPKAPVTRPLSTSSAVGPVLVKPVSDTAAPMVIPVPVAASLQPKPTPSTAVKPANSPVRPVITGQGTPTSDQKPLPVVAAPRQVKLAGIRVGAHADKVRIVIDSAKPITVTDDLDPIEKILVLDIDGADVETAQGPAGGNDVVSRISLRGTGPGLGQAVFELKKITKVQKISSLPPSKDNPNYRTVIDLEK